MRLPEQDILGARILIVDDQEANVRLLERLLGEAGYTNLTSTMDSQEVCALHRENDYDVILLDLQLPVLDGFQVMTALQASSTDNYLPVIVLTAQPGHQLRALLAGARDFISKPFDLLEVKTRIHNMLEVRLLYRQLEAHHALLERTVQQRTAELRESEARFRSLTELASDWYWEQDESGAFTRVSGPVLEMLGIRVDTLRLSRVATGDQAIFVLRSALDAIGGIREPELFEDIDLTRRLKRYGPMAAPRDPVITSSRRWRSDGVWSTTLRMWTLKLLYVCGVPAARLKRCYRDAR